MTTNKESNEISKISLLIIWIISALLIILIGLAVLIANTNHDINEVQKGQYTFDKNTNNPQRLIGEWTFAWNQFLSVEELKNIEMYQSVPSMWNRYKLLNGEKVDAKGYATFGVTIDNVEEGERYCIRIPTIGTAGTFFINDKELTTVGKVDSEKLEYEPKFQVLYKEFIVPDTAFNIVVHVANYDYARGGLWLPIKIAKADDMQVYRMKKNGYEYLVLGILILSLIIAVILTIIFRKQKSVYYFLSGVILVSLYHITNGDKLIAQWIPNISMHGVVRIQYLVMFLLPSAFLEAVIEFCQSKRIVFWGNLLMIHAVIFGVITLLMSISFITHLTYYANSIAYIHIVIYLYILLKGIHDGQKQAIPLLVSGVIMGICVVHDLLYGAALISGANEFIVIGFISVIISMGSILIMHMIQMKEQVQLSEMFEQAYLNAQIKPHFLFNALNTIASVIESDANKAEQLTVSLSTFLRSVIEPDNLKRVQPLDKEIEIVKAYAKIEQARFAKIQVIIDVDENMDVYLPPMTLQPLLENAIKHGLRKKNEGGTVWIALEEQINEYIILVIDDGVGMDINELEQLRATLRSNHIDQVNNKTGIGIVNVNARLMNIYRKPISIRSIKNEGTTIKIVIPK